MYGNFTTGGTSSRTRFFSMPMRESLFGSSAGAGTPGAKGYQL